VCQNRFFFVVVHLLFSVSLLDRPCLFLSLSLIRFNLRVLAGLFVCELVSVVHVIVINLFDCYSNNYCSYTVGDYRGQLC
jgi:hypothetical protein